MQVHSVIGEITNSYIDRAFAREDDPHPSHVFEISLKSGEKLIVKMRYRDYNRNSSFDFRCERTETALDGSSKKKDCRMIGFIHH